MKFQELNQKVSVKEQLQHNESNVVLINLFTVDANEADALLEAWTNDATFMKSQPGFISTQLHKGIAGSSTFLNYAVWENTEAFRNAFTHPEFQKALSKYPNTAIASPHLFKKIAVKNVCVE